jgi:hypothetical protein
MAYFPFPILPTNNPYYDFLVSISLHFLIRLDIHNIMNDLDSYNRFIVCPTFRVEDMTSTDKEVQKEKIQNAFDDQDVFVDIVDFKQYNDNDGNPIGFILEGGIDGVITFSLQVGKTEDLSGIDWTATPEFKADQKNNEIIERLKSYYKEFYEEYRESLY